MLRQPSAVSQCVGLTLAFSGLVALTAISAGLRVGETAVIAALCTAVSVLNFTETVVDTVEELALALG